MPPTGQLYVLDFSVPPQAAGSSEGQKPLISAQEPRGIISLPVHPRRPYRILARLLAEGKTRKVLTAAAFLTRQRGLDSGDPPALVSFKMTLAEPPWFEPDMEQNHSDAEPEDSFVEIYGREAHLIGCRLRRIHLVGEKQMIVDMAVDTAYRINGRASASGSYRELWGVAFNFAPSEGGRVAVPNGSFDRTAGDLRIKPIPQQ